MKTVKVRIACAVDSTGKWNVAGWSLDADGSDALDCALEGLESGEPTLVHWITAEVPVPESAEIEGAVEEGG